MTDGLFDDINQTSLNSAGAVAEAAKRQEKKKREADQLRQDISRQTFYSAEAIKRQDEQITELKKQTAKLEEEIQMTKEAEQDAKRKYRRSQIETWVSIAIAVASLIVAILAWTRPF